MNARTLSQVMGLLSVAMVSLAAAPKPLDPAAVKKMEAALPEKAIVAPARPRRLLIFDLNVNYGGHPSAAYANEAFRLMGEKTGAFQAVVSREAAVFEPQSLKKFDAVFFNNNVGNLFTDAKLRQSLVEFVYGGGGLMGVHGTTVAFTQWPGAKEDWPEFGLMIGGRGANHRDSNEHVIAKLDDAESPLNRCFEGRFEYRDEIFRVHDPYSRKRLRVLMSIDLEKTDLNQGGPPRGAIVRADNDYALAWIRNYGRGRTFYCTIAHNPPVFSDPLMLRFYLGAAQFVLGDLPAPTTPSELLTDAIRAHEKLNWRLGAAVFADMTLFDAIDRAAQLGLLYMAAADSQPISGGIARRFGPGCSSDDMREIRMKLDSAGVRLLAWSMAQLPEDETKLRETFEFARKMGIEVIITKAPPQQLEAVERLCDEHDIRLAIGPGGTPRRLAAALKDRSVRIGAYGDVGAWQSNGINPIDAVGMLKSRLIVVQAGEAVRMGPLLAELRSQSITPVMFAVQPPADGGRGMGRVIETFNAAAMRLVREGTKQE